MMSGSGLALMLRVGLSLGAVLGLFALMARGTRRGFGQSRNRTAPLEVVARQSLVRNASVMVVRAGERQLVLGVTESSVALLAELEHSDAEVNEVARTSPEMGFVPKPSWRNALNSMREMTVRRA